MGKAGIALACEILGWLEEEQEFRELQRVGCREVVPTTAPAVETPTTPSAHTGANVSVVASKPVRTERHGGIPIQQLLFKLKI